MTDLTPLIRKLPKTDLHVHLDGSLRPSTLIALAKERKVKLPAWSEAGLYKKVFKDKYQDLPDYLTGFAYTCSVMGDAEAMERVAFELCEDCQEEGVRYVEMRFAPQLLTRPGFDILDVLKAASKGLRRAEKKFNLRAAVKKGEEPPFRAGIIVCGMRFFLPGFSHAYAEMFSAFADLPQSQLFGMASEVLVRAAIRARDDFGLPVVGFDIAGAERGYPAKDHASAFALAHDAFLGVTVHAGEDYGPESIYQALTDCHADRLGHGTWMFSPSKIQDLSISSPKSFVEGLTQFIADRRVTVEVCLTSNLQTLPSIQTLKKHPFRKMVAGKFSTALCTDNRLVSRTTVTREYQLAADAFGLSAADLGNHLVYGFKRCFFPGSYSEKRAYVRQVLNYRDRILAEFQEKS